MGAAQQVLAGGGGIRPYNPIAEFHTFAPTTGYSCVFTGPLFLQATVTNSTGFQGFCLNAAFKPSVNRTVFEYTVNSSTASACVGIADVTTYTGNIFVGGNPQSIGYYVGTVPGGASSGSYQNNVLLTSGVSLTTNDVLGVIIDFSAGTISFFKNGIFICTNPHSLTNANIVAGAGNAQSPSGLQCVGTFNFGATPFAYSYQ